MNARKALCTALLNGKTVNGKVAFSDFGFSNVSREVIRGVEKPFDITLTRTKKQGKSRYGQAIVWFNYQLDPIKPENIEGVKLMREYLSKGDSNGK